MEEAPIVQQAGESLPLPSPPTEIQLGGHPEELDITNYSVVSRPGLGTLGKKIPLLANHFKVSVHRLDAIFYQYTVSITSGDEKPIESKRLGRKLMDKFCKAFSSDLGGKTVAYDGEKSLYTVGPLPRNNLDFSIVLEESFAKRNNDDLDADGVSQVMATKRSKHSLRPINFKLSISFSATIPLNSIALALEGEITDQNAQVVLRVLDIILRQQACERGCLLVRQSFFHDDSSTFSDVGGGVLGVRGFHSSFRPTQGGLSLNMDVSTTMIIKPGPVIDFLLANQNVKETRYVDWAKAKRMLKNLRVNAIHRGVELKIHGLSDKPCNQLFFPMKIKKGDGDDDSNGEAMVDITVHEYFVKHVGIELTYSQYLPCLDVGKSNRPLYLPLEVCSLVSLQRYTRSLSSLQRASLVEISRQKPREKMQTLTDAARNYNYDGNPMIYACGISIEKQFMQIGGRILDTPKLKVGNNDDCLPRNGRWNFNNKTLIEPIHIKFWIIVNFSARCDTSALSRQLINCGRSKGIQIERPYTILEEDPILRKCTPVDRVEAMYKMIVDRLPDGPALILCVLPERKCSDLYGPWKKKSLCEFDIATQCIAPTKISDQYLTNVLLKINAKLGGMNSMLAIEKSGHVPLIQEAPTMILGMDVSHGSPGRTDAPSIAAVVGSRYWPLISKYRASLRTQSSKLEMIEALHKPLPDGNDNGMIRELLVDFYKTSGGRKPTRIIIFRDGVSESQFNKVMNIELDQIIKAYQHLGAVDAPKITLIICQKKHHTKLFQAGGPENVPSGTVVDAGIVHPSNFDFYMCTHGGAIGTSRPAHYHVLVDEIGFSADGMQTLILLLSYAYQRSTAAASLGIMDAAIALFSDIPAHGNHALIIFTLVNTLFYSLYGSVAPICYAHLAAAQMGQFMKFDDSSEISCKSPTSSGILQVPELPRLQEKVSRTMFFC